MSFSPAPPRPSRRTYLRRKYGALALTFVAYASFHMSRKVPSIAGPQMHPSSASLKWHKATNPGWAPFSNDLDPSVVLDKGMLVAGAGVPGANGLYTCNRSMIWHADKRDKHGEYPFCGEFHRPGFVLTHSKIAVVANVTPAGRHWWAIATHPQGRVLYMQDNTTTMPVVTTTAPGDTRASWDWHPVAGAGRNVGDAPSVVRPNTTNGKVLLGACLTVYLSFYAAGMFVTGRIADALPVTRLRAWLVFGMAGSAVLVGVIGCAGYLDIHSLGFFFAVYAVQGIFQSIGWPSVVAIVGNWFGHGGRGTIMGVWNAHTSVGNILGSVLATAALNINEAGWHGHNWPMAFIVPAVVMLLATLLVGLFLRAHPSEIGLTEADVAAMESTGDDASTSATSSSSSSAAEVLLEDPVAKQGEADITSRREDGGGSSSSCCNDLIAALCVPGVLEFALALFFAKFVAYTFIYWTPYYLTHNFFSPSAAGFFCTFVDIGGIVGGALAGYLSDRIGSHAIICWSALLLAVPVLYAFHALTSELGTAMHDGRTSYGNAAGGSISAMLVVGAFINAPYALITTAVSADLGSRLKSDEGRTSIATVTAIIDGTGSVGACLQGIVIGAISASFGWESVFYFLMICCFISALLLMRLVIADFRRICGATTSSSGAGGAGASDAGLGTDDMSATEAKYVLQLDSED